jgi:putative thioredoxin
MILAKAEVDHNQTHAQKFGVMSIPAVKLFKNGEIVDEFIGAQPEATIKEWLDKKL